jgi:hypothetical protein
MLQNSKANKRKSGTPWACILAAGCMLVVQSAFGNPSDPQIPNIFKPESTHAHSIFQLSLFVLAITAVIFVVVFSSSRMPLSNSATVR